MDHLCALTMGLPNHVCIQQPVGLPDCLSGPWRSYQGPRYCFDLNSTL